MQEGFLHNPVVDGSAILVNVIGHEGVPPFCLNDQVLVSQPSVIICVCGQCMCSAAYHQNCHEVG